MTKEKKYVIGVLGLVALGAVALAINIFSTTPEPTPAVEYRAVCRNLPANAHRNGSGEKNDGTRKEIPQIQTSPNVRVPNPVGMYDEVGSDTECHFVCDEGFNRDGNSNCLLSVTIWEFDYTGNPQTFTAPRDGRYEVEAWGAEGSGYRAYEGYGGKGAYTKGIIFMNTAEVLYVYVGQAGRRNSIKGGQNYAWNGGGGGSNTCANSQSYVANYIGAGATDIRLVAGERDNMNSLVSRLMVAGAGGSARFGTGGNGGTLQGFNGGGRTYYGDGGTQLAGGANAGSFGKGGNAVNGANTCNSSEAAGGGGGYWGGGGVKISSNLSDDTYKAGGGGGSSFISGYTGAVAIASASDTSPKSGCTDGTTDVTCSYHYSGKIFSGAVMKAGNEEMPNPRGTGTSTGNAGNGYARISFVEEK